MSSESVNTSQDLNYDNSLQDEIVKLRKEINEYKCTIQNLQQDINVMKPFVDLTKLMHKERPELWNYYAAKTVHNNNNKIKN